MNTKEINEKETAHLRRELVDTTRHLFDLRSQAVTEKLEDPSQLGKARKQIARLRTILRQRELDATQASQETSQQNVAAQPQS